MLNFAMTKENNNPLNLAATVIRQKIMKTTANNIISENINNIQFIELCEFMQEMIEQSMNALDSHDAEHLMWYEDCSMTDYFQEWTEIWNDDDEMVGEGIDTVAHSFVLNDSTRADFECAFEQARDNAFERIIKVIAEEVEEYEEDIYNPIESIDLDDSLTEDEERLLEADAEYIKAAGDEAVITYTPSMFIADHINNACDGLEKRGYKKIACDSSNDLIFFLCEEFCNRLIEEGCSVDKIAEWLGATVVVTYQGADADDYQKTWYK